MSFQQRRLPCLPYDAGAAAITEVLRKQRIVVGAMDLKIASIVLASDAVLITRNIGDFRKVPGLRLEDWASEGDRKE